MVGSRVARLTRAGCRFSASVIRTPIPLDEHLVSNDIDAQEVSRLAGFIAAIDAEIPYALLALGPHFALGELPGTSQRHADEAQAAARAAGLRTARVTNHHLLPRAY